MAKKLYVGGLPYSATDDDLKEFFSQAGNVESATVIIDKMTGRSRGFGFVEMASDEEFNRAVELNGKEFDGRTITVNEAREREEGSRPRFGGGGNRGGFGGGRGNSSGYGRKNWQ